MASHKPSLVHPKYKTKYRVGNWSEYERGLRSRGDVTIWFTKEALDAWIPPSRTAVVSGKNTPAGRARDATVLRVRDVGRRRWKKESGYHRQARAENAFFRYKRLLGGALLHG